MVALDTARYAPPRQPYHIPAISSSGLWEQPPRTVHMMVMGRPITQGSKNAFPIWRGKPCRACGRKAFSHCQLTESSEGWEAWRALVCACGIRAMRPGGVVKPALDGPLAAAVTFTLPRPVSHPKRVRTEPTGSYDIDKLQRAIGDALTDAKVIADDARILGFTRLWKCYPLLPGMEARPWLDDDALSLPGVVIRVWQVQL